ncbi:MAG TPA: fatty acid desaturase [Anaeromyxobacteraceae bacterium]|nr:fatty acid desaturase [Anaeromyxobacteraceae bacterium]
MSELAIAPKNPPSARAARSERYGLLGATSARAVEAGRAEAEWYRSPVPPEIMRELVKRRDGPALRDTVLWFALIAGTGALTVALWPSGWAIAPYLVYAVLYASTSDSRWHESGHGTAFATDWMNDSLYEIASFMVMRESVFWRWSHIRHHSDTLVVGRDPEIAVPRPPSPGQIAASFLGLPSYPVYFRGVARHVMGRVSPVDREIVPESEFPKLFLRARIYLAIYAAVILLALWSWSVLPLLLVGLTNIFGTWLMVVYSDTQHAGLAEDVLDHRLNCRTVIMNRLHRYLYWNMGWHVEHHMFPTVPYHALPRLHMEVRDDMPAPYRGLFAAWREIVPALRRQMRDPTYFVKREVPAPSKARGGPVRIGAQPDREGWVDAGPASALPPLGILRVDVGQRTYAVARDLSGALYATDGVCTHGNAHLAEGLVKDDFIECRKHNARYRLHDGAPVRPPACRGLATYPVEERAGRLRVNMARPGGAGARPPRALRLRVTGGRMVAIFIREIELELEPDDPGARPDFTPGDYLQVEIPPYPEIRLGELEVPEPYRAAWEREGLLSRAVSNPAPGRRNNYSLACNPAREQRLRLNVRLAAPPSPDLPPGIGSSYMFRLRPGDVVTALGPFGDFHLKPTQREMVFIGGGAGMAPLRAQISHLFETEGTRRKVSFWYGARSRQELFYDDYFRALARGHSNFTFRTALSAPLPEDRWEGAVGLIHEVVLREYLREHPRPASAEYYLCGPPRMIQACTTMLRELGVPTDQVAYDEF